MVFAVIEFVSQNIGSQFVESPPIKLSTLYEDTSSTIPLVFVLSPGSDPMSSFLRFAKEKNYMERYVLSNNTLDVLTEISVHRCDFPFHYNIALLLHMPH